MKYKFDKKYFVSNDNDVVTLGKNTFSVGFDSDLSQKVLSKLCILGKPYVSCDECEVVEKPKPKAKPKAKKKKVKIDEPKEETKPEPTTDTEESES
jgi:hypothetical protein